MHDRLRAPRATLVGEMTRILRGLYPKQPPGFTDDDDGFAGTLVPRPPRPAGTGGAAATRFDGQI